MTPPPNRERRDIEQSNTLLAEPQPVTGVAPVPTERSTGIAESASSGSNPASSTAPPLVAGRYGIVGLIGRGGMGAVYRARQVNIGRDVAVKVVNSFVLQDQQLIRRFENEARIISALRHPNTLKLIDFGKTRDQRPYLVTEFLVGRPLERVLKEGAVVIDRGAAQ